MIKLIPFSNGTEAMQWIENNCNECTTKCHYKRNIELGFVTGDITINTAEFIGYKTKDYELKNGDSIYLYNLCQNKNKYKKKKRPLKNQQKLF